MDWEQYGYVIASKYRIKVLRSLLVRPKSPTEISIENRITLSHTSRTLAQLSSRKLLYCVNPLSKKGKVYSLNKNAIEIAKFLSDKVSSIS